MRETGVLMPVSSLPSRTGVGELGQEACTFIRQLKEAGMSIWQLLPLNPVGYGNSPYQPYSSFAGDEIYISLDRLYESGLLETLVPSYMEHEARVRYDEIRAWKDPYFREAYKKFVPTEGYEEFASQKWVVDYGVFRALKKSNDNHCWNEWSKSDKNWPEYHRELSEEQKEEAGYQIFLQYMFFVQWMEVKACAAENGIRIMGDVPFYVGLDSADVWAGKDNFLLDTDGRPLFIAGVPPDYFSETGQRWGNPIYDWNKLKKDGYRFWIDRIGYNGKLFDIVRIDHFRAFDTYWKIPVSCPTAIEGEWIEAPGYEVLDTLKERVPEVELVAEDLGDLRPEVLKLKEHYHLKGMKITVFSIDTSGKYARDISKETENMIIYSGTHDNDTLMQWYQELTVPAKRKVRRFLARKGIRQGSVKDRLLAYILSSKAEYAIIPMGDIMGLGKEAHLNTPGTIGSPNWEWRMPDAKKIEKALQQFKIRFNQ